MTVVSPHRTVRTGPAGGGYQGIANYKAAVVDAGSKRVTRIGRVIEYHRLDRRRAPIGRFRLDVSHDLTLGADASRR